MKKKQLTLTKKWKEDIEGYKKSSKNLVATPICERCRFYIKGNVFQCMVYTGQSEKPEFVIFPNKECPEFKPMDELEIHVKSEKEQRLFGGLFGFIVGDAMGVPVEFCTRIEREKDPVKEMRAYGTYHQPYGTWSDDTSLMLCLMESIIEGYSIESLAKKFMHFYQDSYLTPYGEIFDIGIATQVAIERMMQGIHPKECGGILETDNGNGSLMRILPLAYFIQDMDLLEQKRVIEEVSSVTHNHKRAKLACIMYVRMAINLINGDDKIEAYQKMISFVLEYCRDYEEEMAHFNRILSKKIIGIDAKEIKSSGYVVDTLEAAIWSFLKNVNYSDGILQAINFGGDTDTIAAITGGLAGIYYGIDKIPNNWIQLLARKEEIYQVIKLFNNYVL
ncbi:MAG: ADP-ribosylglycohydrolase family protein [Cellulosilyticaceae bacterium]